MDSSQADYRELFESIHAKHERPLYWYLLAPWIESHTTELDWIRSFGNRKGEPFPSADIEDLWRLYALGRINETLLLRFQQGRANGSDWAGPQLSADEYLMFAESLGLTVSTLYWAYRRKNRPYQDVSHGWGSNSQWRTRFRRDFRIGDEFYYSVDDKNDLSLMEPTEVNNNGLTREECVELLTNRCFLITTKPHHDLWPYDDFLRTKS
jgi:hypothetical protein